MIPGPGIEPIIRLPAQRGWKKNKKQLLILSNLLGAVLGARNTEVDSVHNPGPRSFLMKAPPAGGSWASWWSLFLFRSSWVRDRQASSTTSVSALGTSSESDNATLFSISWWNQDLQSRKAGPGQKMDFGMRMMSSLIILPKTTASCISPLPRG